ncbi:CaiB/BaiF CoA transferase family protein [Enterovirga aerilata]|uniref:CoA transferase n=1 Tax=Enterovirga aerilata TaxID=2730920 RepID=A0A849IEL2_9HYPH|nr:CoA transferase [Enterovirga sp. DB1703]NNM74665.1 CoA transferase [Enterovirga sp. DB1703]
MSGPLTGLKVIELGQLIAAPFATRLLAEFGATVIKVEPPGTGDPLRKWRKTHDGTSLWSYVQSRNKHSVTIDLKAPEGQDIVRRLASEADVVVENFRPGTLEKWGLGFEELAKLNPRIVLVRLSGYGQTGPYRERPGFGVIGEAIGGIRYTTGSPDRPPSRVGVSIGDSLAALHAVIGTLMAIVDIARNGGTGQVVDVSLYESVFNIMESLIPEYGVLGEIRERSGGALPGIAPTNAYEARDGYVLIAGNGDSIFRRLMKAIGRDDIGQDPRFADNAGRAAEADLIDAAIEAWTKERTAEEALAVMNEASVPAGRIYNAADIMGDPHYRAREMIIETRLPDGTPMPVPGIVPKLSRTPGSMRWLGPKLGEHTDQVLAEAGYSAEEVADLRRRGIV